MELGVVTTAFADLPLADVLEHCRRLGITKLELGAGGFFPKNHCNPKELLADKSALATFTDLLKRNDMSVCAFAVHGEPLHPDPAIAESYKNDFRDVCELAYRLGVTKLTLLAGLPGASANDPNPNWIVNPFPPRNLQQLEWQWTERLLPYWKMQAQVATGAGVQLCFEMVPPDLVYFPGALLRLREAIGPIVGANLDPSHLIWQGMDATEVIDELGDAIYHVHAKDARVSARNVRRQGILDAKPFTNEPERSWLFRTVGYGSGPLWWRDFISALRVVGYDGVISIEHEDPLFDRLEALEKAVEFLRPILPEKPRANLWFNA
jgi:sugar phosphate isomerase/epimerase